ncbi:MAG: methylthioribulose 1-phosphate dehydratase [Myxococcales bacterium]|nr:methylthioribulose 1-phosphate dehydratase [Myxococcales bacterium]
MHHDAPLTDLVAACRWAGARGWTPATGGNFSVRLSDGRVAITASGVDKGAATVDDLLLIDAEGQVLGEMRRPSAETPLHLALYRLSSDIGSVLHTHSVAATVLSRLTPGSSLVLQGFEMQKSLSGQTTHEGAVHVALFDNDQDMQRLSGHVAERWPLQHGLLVRGHGLYAWGRDVPEARRHLEGLEFLLACQLELERSTSRRT